MTHRTATGRRESGWKRGQAQGVGETRPGLYLQIQAGVVSEHSEGKRPLCRLLVVGFCNDGRRHVLCDTVTANVTHHNRNLRALSLGKESGEGYIEYIRTRALSHTRCPPTEPTYIHTRGSAITRIKRINVPAFVRFASVSIYWPDPDPRFEIIPSQSIPHPIPSLQSATLSAHP